MTGAADDDAPLDLRHLEHPLDTGGVLVSDRIQIEFDVSAVKVG